MSYLLSNAVRYLQHPEMNGTAKAILRNLLDHADDDGTNIFPSVGTICKETGFDRKAVFRALDFLKSTFIELCEAINLGGRVGKLNKMMLSKDKFINSIVNEKERIKVSNFLLGGAFASTEMGTSKPLASTQKGFARPQSGTQLNQYSSNNINLYNNTNNNLEIIPSYKEKVVVVPTEYSHFEALPKVQKVKNEVSQQTNSEPLAEKPKAKIEVEREDLPLSVIEALSDAKIEGTKYNRKILVRWTREYGEKYIIEKIQLTKKEMERREVNSPMGWLTEAIRWNFKQNSANQKTHPTSKQPFCKVVDELPQPKVIKPCAREWWENTATEQQKIWTVSVFNNHDPVLLERFGYEKMKDYYHSEEFYYSAEFRSMASNFRINFRYPTRPTE